ncbi:hypothetical protein N7512_005776 [Penicillium capsulatum]|nr:hypothetical protein N7512_005776 [Penicillium capsulatum]
MSSTSHAWLVNYRTGNMNEFKGEYEWSVKAVAHMSDDNSLSKPDLQYPHLKAVMRTATSVACAKNGPHIIPPIFMVSIMGHRHARVLESHFDGETLVVRKTQLFDFTKENIEITSNSAK